MKLTTTTSNGDLLELHLEREHWNDYGYTLIWNCSLWKNKERKCSFGLSIAEPDISVREYAFPDDYNPDFISFAGPNAIAKLCLHLTPKERCLILSKLHMKFDTTRYMRKQWFQKSILRGYNNMADFMETQRSLSGIINSEDDFTPILQQYINLTNRKEIVIEKWLNTNFPDNRLKILEETVIEILKEVN